MPSKTIPGFAKTKATINILVQAIPRAVRNQAPGIAILYDTYALLNFN